jgi:sarcosine oxidase subunit alpha
MILKVGTDIDMSPESFTFMGFKEGKIGGAPVRVFRISFSGELSYEIATPSLYGLPLWRALFDVGSKDYDITAYGTEALHVMRAEKGYIMIGDETDGTVIPHDVGLSGLVSRKKEDFIGKRALQRSHLIHGNRRVLVGLETEDPKVIIPHGSYAVENILQKPPMKTIGYVTSSYWSPTLGRSIAMALIEAKKTLGEKVAFPQADGRVIKARIVSPVFYDKDGERQNV